VAYVGATELLLLPQVGRPFLAANTVLEFWDYGWPYLEVVLAEDLAADATIAQVERIKAHLYPTARAAVGPYPLEGATLSGSILDGQDGAAIATFTPRFVGALSDGVIDSEFALDDLPPFLEPCDDPPYWLRTSVTQGGNTTILLLGQTEARVRLPENSDVLVRFEALPGLDANQVVGAGAMTLPGVQLSGAASLGLIMLGDGSIILPAVLTGGLGAILLSANGLQLLPIVATAGTGAIAVSGSGAQTLPTVATAGGSETVLSGSGAATFSPVQTSGAGAVAVAGSGAATLPTVQTSGIGAIAVTGSGSQILPSVITAGSSGAVLAGDGAALLPSVATVGTASAQTTGAGAATVSAVQTAGAGNLQVAGAGAASLPTVATNGAATVETAGIIPILIPSLF
jgi:hypothetical protein